MADPTRTPDRTKDDNAAGEPAPDAPAGAPAPNANPGTNNGGGIGQQTQDPPDPSDPEAGSSPIVLDLAGRGIGITQLTSSNTFAAIDTDGYEHRTAWAATGDAVLFVDPNGLNTIRDANQYIFTDWDPSATTDMQALRDVFDTDHDGKLDSNDAAFGQFKLMVTNADGTTSVETLTQAGITSIDLTADTVTRAFADGSSIDGETSFTRADGTTGTVAAVTLAADATGYAVKTTTTVNADGSTTVDNRALRADGSLANDTASTTSADGTTRTIAYDSHGVGVIDHTQTIVATVDASGTRTETVSDLDGQGQLTDATTTTTSADGTLVTIARDLTGGGVTNQTETRQTGADGSVVDTLTDLSADGTMIDQTVTTSSADGLDRLTQVDSTGRVDADGNDVFDRTTQDTTVVAGDGSRSETLTITAVDGGQISGTVIETSADSQTRTSAIDRDGDGTTDRTVVSQTSANADGSVTTTTTILTGDQTLVLGTTATTLSADGLSKTTAVDLDGDGTVDRTTSDITYTNTRGGQTEDVTVTSADGTSLSEVLTSRDPNGVSRNTAQFDGGGNLLSSDEIGVGPQGATEETASTFGTDGTLLGQTQKTTSADGLTTTTRIDSSGDGTSDRVVADQTIENGDGSATEVAGTRSADGTLLGRTVVYTSADGLTITTQVDSSGLLNPDGTGVFDRTTTDATSYTDDGSRIRAVTVTAADGTVLSSVSTDTGAGRQSHSVTTDANGDGFTTTFEQVTTAADGTVTDGTTDYNPDGSTVDAAVRTTSANGQSITTQIDAAGTGTYNRTTTDVTTIALDGQRTEVVTNTDEDGDVVGRTVMLSQANGDSSSMRVDTTGSGLFDHVANTERVYNADGGTSVTVTDKAADRSTRDETVTTTSGDGLTVTTQHDLDGDGTFDQTTIATTAYNADGSVTTTTADLYGDGSDASEIRDQTVSTLSGDGRSMASQTDYEGSVVFSRTETKATQANGDVVDTTSTFTSPDGSGTPLTTTAVTTSGNGLSKTTRIDVDGNGTFDTTLSDVTVLNDDGSRTETVTSSGSAGLNGQTVTRTSGNGLSTTVMTDTAGNGTVDLTTRDDVTLNTDGSRLETYTQTNQDSSIRSSTAITTSADRKHVSVARYLGAEGSQSETIDRGADGTVTDVLRDTDGMGLALGGEKVVTSANGLVKSAAYTDAAGTVQDTQTDARVLNGDGSTTERFSDVDTGAGVSAFFVTTTSGNGLVKTTTASFAAVPLSPYTTLDTTTLNTDGTLNDTIATTNADGSTRDQSVRTVSADGLVTTSSLDDDADGNAEITDRKQMATDGSMVRTTTIYNGLTHAQDRQDIVTTSTDGRTVTLASARDGDPTVRYTETTVEAADGTISDSSQFTSGTLAPSYSQSRTQTLDTTGGQTVVISDHDTTGALEDQTTTTVSGNGLSTRSMIDVTGDGVADLIQIDTTVINPDGTRLETIAKTSTNNPPAGTIFPAGTTGYNRSVSTSADGLTVRTDTDDDGNGVFEKSETSTRAVDGSLVDTVTFNDNTTGKSVMAQATDGSESAGIVETTSADGLMVNTAVGEISTQKTYLAGSNGSYRWTQNQNSLSSLYAAPSASHDVDVNGVDTWTSSYVPDVNSGVGPNTTTTIQIDTAKEQAAIAQANSIYQTLLDRPMMDAEQESLIQYIQGGILDRQALAKSLIASNSLGASFGLNFIQTSYENDFGHDLSASDTAAFLNEYQTNGLAAVTVDIAEKAVNEQAGNGLLALLPNAPLATAMTVTLISPETANLTNTGANYAAFVNMIGKPSGNLTPGQISQFAALTGDTGASTAPQINFASASSSTSGQGTTVPDFFSGTSSTARAPGGGAAGPLVVNLAGAKVHTSDLATSTVKFDDTGSGTASTTAWTTQDEGFLVLDPAGVQVTDGSSMISTFSALATYDGNGDGTLTSAEADQAGIKIWVDANADGVDQAGELETLSQAGIVSIDLKDAQTGSYDHGNIVAADASFTFTDGRTGDIADAWLAYGGALAQGAVYQFGDDVVTRAADGTASELLYGTGETVDGGAMGLSNIVDTGGSNVLQASTAANVTLSGAAGDQLVGGSGADTLLAVGDGETVTTGTGTNAVYVSGASTRVDASLGTSTISLDGAGDSVVGATSTTTVDVTKGTGATIAAVGSKITIEGGVDAEISGSDDTITAAGHSTITLDASGSTLQSDAASTVTINGANNTVSLDRASTVSVVGTGEILSLTSGTLTLATGASAKVTGNNDGVTQASGSSLSLAGLDGVVDITGTGVVTAVDDGDVVLENSTSDTLMGTGDQVVQTAGTALCLTGTNASLVVMGTSNQSTLSDARITIQDGASSHLTGSRDIIAVGSTGLNGALAGSDDRVTISGTGAQLSIAGARDVIAMSGGSLQLADGSSATLTGSNDTATLYNSDSLAVVGSGDTVTAYGQNDTVSIDGEGGSIAGNNSDDTLTLTGSNGSVVAYGSDTKVAVAGNNDSIVGNNSGDTLTLTGSNGSVVAYGGNTTVMVTGNSDSVTADGFEAAITLSGTNETVAAYNSSTVTLLDGSSATVSGGQNVVALGDNSSLVLNSSGDVVTTSGSGDTVTVSGQSDIITVAGAAGTATILYNATGSTTVVTGSGNTVEVDSAGSTLKVMGSNNTLLSYGAGDILTLGGANNVLTSGGQGSTLSVTGATDTTKVFGANATVSLTGTGDILSVSGQNDTVTVAGANGTATVLYNATGSTTSVTGSGNTVEVDSAGSTLKVMGSNNTLLSYGTGDILTLGGANNVLTSGGQGSTLSVTGATDTATVFGADETASLTGTGDILSVSGQNDTVTVAGANGTATILYNATGSTTSVTGSGNTVEVDSAGSTLKVTGGGNTLSSYGTGDTVSLGGGNDTLTMTGQGSSVSIAGANDVVTAGGANETVTATGNGDTVIVASTAATLSIGSGIVGLYDSTSASVSGSGNTVDVGKGSAAKVSGSGNTINFFQSNSIVQLQNDGKGINTVSSGGISVIQAGDGKLSVYGGLASSAVTTSSSSPSIALGNGNTVSTITVPTTIDGYAANGLHSWEDIFDTMSGALKETDQYQYNASNSLMEIDRYNASNVKTEADLYDPTTSAEIGSYLYGSNGSVNEVVDLLHNHDWLSQSDGSYKDKTSGAVSKTQPTLR